MSQGMIWSKLRAQASALRWGQLLMLTVLAAVAVVSGVKLILSWADRSASCPFASTYSDSLVANRVRLAAIDRLLARYDLSQIRSRSARASRAQSRR
jgi:hypothetical protein